MVERKQGSPSHGTTRMQAHQSDQASECQQRSCRRTYSFLLVWSQIACCMCTPDIYENQRPSQFWVVSCQRSQSLKTSKYLTSRDIEEFCIVERIEGEKMREYRMEPCYNIIRHNQAHLKFMTYPQRENVHPSKGLIKYRCKLWLHQQPDSGHLNVQSLPSDLGASEQGYLSPFSSFLWHVVAPLRNCLKNNTWKYAKLLSSPEHPRVSGTAWENSLLCSLRPSVP